MVKDQLLCSLTDRRPMWTFVAPTVSCLQQTERGFAQKKSRRKEAWPLGIVSPCDCSEVGGARHERTEERPRTSDMIPSLVCMLHFPVTDWWPISIRSPHCQLLWLQRWNDNNEQRHPAPVRACADASGLSSNVEAIQSEQLGPVVPIPSSQERALFTPFPYACCRSRDH